MADGKIDAVTKAAFGAAVALAVIVTLIGEPLLAWLVAPFVLGLLVWILFTVPLRHSLMGIMFCSITLENPNEAPAAGLWRSPLYDLGAIMLTHMNKMTGLSFLSVSGTDLLLIILIGVALHRRSSGSTIDGVRGFTVPKPLIQLTYLSLLGTAFTWISGLLRGGEFQKSLWQVEKVTYLPILFLLFQAALRGPRDYLALGRVLLTAAVLRAMMAIYVANVALEEKPHWATTHHDSMLFACAIVIIVSLAMHRAHRTGLKLALATLPILIWGMVDNNRRTVWVQIMMVFVVLYFAIPDNPAKKKIKRLALLTSPLTFIYVVIGWRSTGGIFKPVQNIRSAISPSTDVSTLVRDIENYCIARTIASNPLFGLGYGNRYFEVVSLPPMPHPLEPWLPHNSLLGLWFAAGFVGYTAMTLLWTAGVYFGVRAYRFAKDPLDRSVALVCFGSVLIYLIQCYADLGLGSLTGVYMVAASIAIAGQLAISTGAWPAKPAASVAA